MPMTHLIRTLRTELWSSAKKVIYSTAWSSLLLGSLALGKIVLALLSFWKSLGQYPFYIEINEENLPKFLGVYGYSPRAISIL